MKSSSLSQIKIQKLQKYYFQIIIFLTFLFPSLASSDNSAFTEADFARSIQVKQIKIQVEEICRKKLRNMNNLTKYFITIFRKTSSSRRSLAQRAAGDFCNSCHILLVFCLNISTRPSDHSQYFEENSHACQF